MGSLRCTALVVAVLEVCLAWAASGRAAESQTRAVTISISNNVNGKDGTLRGTVRFRVPRNFQKDTFVAGRGVERFMTTDANGCTAHLVVSVRPVATRRTTAQQVERSLLPIRRAADLGRGRRPHGSWGVDDTSVTAEHRLYGISPVHVDGNLYAQIRATVNFEGPCTEESVRTGVVLNATKRIVREGTIKARYVPDPE